MDLTNGVSQRLGATSSATRRITVITQMPVTVA